MVLVYVLVGWLAWVGRGAQRMRKTHKAKENPVSITQMAGVRTLHCLKNFIINLKTPTQMLPLC